MAIPNTSVSSDDSEQSGTHMANSNTNQVQAPSNQQSRSFSPGPVAIFWDLENCPVPSDVRPEDVASNIITALRVHFVIRGPVTMFYAYGDFNAFPMGFREGFRRAGVKLIDVPNGRRDAADKAILVDMLVFALDNPPPSSIMLISRDVDFAPALRVLGQREHTVILVIPSGVGVSSALSNAGRFVLDWPSVARGGPNDIVGYLMPFHSCDNPDGLNEEEAIVYRGGSQSYYNSRDFSIVSQSLSEYNNSVAILAGPTSSGDQNESTLSVQPGDLNGLNGQLVKLLELSGGSLPLIRVSSEYQKIFGRPLCVSEYGASKLVNLFQYMGDSMAVVGEGKRRFVYLRAALS